MLNAQKTLVTVMISLFTNLIHAQIGAPNELDGQFTPKGTGPLSAESKSNNSNKNYNSDYPKNIIKFTPTSLVRSLIVFNYERNFLKNFSVTGGLGLSYSKDVLFTFIGSEMDFSSVSSLRKDGLSISSIMQNSSSNGISPYFSGGLKIIYESWFTDQLRYVEFVFQNYSNKLSYNLNESSGSTKYTLNNYSPLKVNFSNFAVKWAMQFQTEGNISTTHELFLIAGLRTSSYNLVTINSNSNSISYNIESTKVKTNSILFGFGYTFGIGFN